MKWYVGMMRGTTRSVAFPSEIEPSDKTHGDLYSFFTGPFWSREGAEYAAKNREKISLQGVPDYEKAARMEEF